LAIKCRFNILTSLFKTGLAVSEATKPAVQQTTVYKDTDTKNKNLKLAYYLTITTRQTNGQLKPVWLPPNQQSINVHRKMIMLKPQNSHHRSTAFIIVGGLVALASLLVIASSSCGSLNLKLLPSVDVQLKKEACPK